MFLNKSQKLAIVDFENNQISHEDLVNNVKYYSEYNINKDGNKEFGIIMMENRKEWFYAFYSLWDRKFTPIAIDALSSVDELKYFLTDSGAKAIYVSNTTKEVAEKAVSELGFDVAIFNVDEFEFSQEKFELIKKDERILRHPEGEETAVMIYTSGTTGSPKGVMLTYNNIIAQMDSIHSVKGTIPEEQLLAVLPFHHILPLMITNLFLMHHSNQFSVVLVEKLSSKDILAALEKNRVTMLILVPRVYYMFYKSIKDTIDSKWVTRTAFKVAKAVNKTWFSKIVFKQVHQKFGGHIRDFLAGGAKSEKEVIEFFDTLGFRYSEGYGLTETSPLVAASTPENGKKAGTVGLPVKNVEIKIVDGELWVKGPIVMKGYYNKPDKTAEVLTEDGWFKTGDLVELDEDGYINIIGRKNAMIVLSNGKNIDPEKLEFKFMEESKGGIKEIGIFANKDKLTALIVIDSEEAKLHNISNIHAYVKDLVEFYNAKVHNHEKILEYRITEEELPKTRIGKTRRFMLKDIYLKDKVEKKVEQEDNIPRSNEYRVIKKFIENMKGKLLTADENLEIEYGLDSLDQVELISFIQSTFGVVIAEKEFKENSTLAKLSDYVAQTSNVFNENVTNQWENIVKNAPKKDLEEGILGIILKPILWVAFKIYFRLGLHGKDKIKDKPQIIIANHQSFLDSLAISLMFDNKILKKTYTLAIDWYFKNKFMEFVGKNTNVVLVDIDGDIKGSLETLSNILKQGKNIMIFPEGTRTKDGNISQFKKAFAILAKELNVDITCIKIDGAFDAFSRYMKFPRPKKVDVTYLGEIKPEGLTYEEIVKKAKEMYK